MYAVVDVGLLVIMFVVFTQCDKHFLLLVVSIAGHQAGMQIQEGFNYTEYKLMMVQK